jgi:hypothetical protein
MRISFKLGSLIIHSIVDFVDFVEDDSTKGKRKLKMRYIIFFLFWQAKSLMCHHIQQSQR